MDNKVECEWIYVIYSYLVCHRFLNDFRYTS